MNEGNIKESDNAKLLREASRVNVYKVGAGSVVLAVESIPAIMESEPVLADEAFHVIIKFRQLPSRFVIEDDKKTEAFIKCASAILKAKPSLANEFLSYTRSIMYFSFCSDSDWVLPLMKDVAQADPSLAPAAMEYFKSAAYPGKTRDLEIMQLLPEIVEANPDVAGEAQEIVAHIHRERNLSPLFSAYKKAKKAIKQAKKIQPEQPKQEKPVTQIAPLQT